MISFCVGRTEVETGVGTGALRREQLFVAFQLTVEFAQLVGCALVPDGDVEMAEVREPRESQARVEARSRRRLASE